MLTKFIGLDLNASKTLFFVSDIKYIMRDFLTECSIFFKRNYVTLSLNKDWRVVKVKKNSLKIIRISTLSVAMLTVNFLPTVGHAQVSTENATENTMVASS